MAKIIPFSKSQHLSNLARKSSVWIAYLLITALIMRTCTGPARASGVSISISDTLPKKQYQYFYKAGIGQLNDFVYIADSLSRDYGIDLNGTQIRSSQKLYLALKEALIRSLAVDSVEIKTKTK